MVLCLDGQHIRQPDGDADQRAVQGLVSAQRRQHALRVHGRAHEAVHVLKGAGAHGGGRHPLRLLPRLQEAHDDVLHHHKHELRRPKRPRLAQGLRVLQLHQEGAEPEHDRRRHIPGLPGPGRGGHGGQHPTPFRRALPGELQLRCVPPDRSRHHLHVLCLRVRGDVYDTGRAALKGWLQDHTIRLLSHGPVRHGAVRRPVGPVPDPCPDIQLFHGRGVRQRRGAAGAQELPQHAVHGPGGVGRVLGVSVLLLGVPSDDLLVHGAEGPVESA